MVAELCISAVRIAYRCAHGDVDMTRLEQDALVLVAGTISALN
jgi:hypothetical protein